MNALVLLLAQFAVDGGVNVNGDVHVSGNVWSAALIAPYVAATVWLEAPTVTTGTDGQGITVMGMQFSNAPGPDLRVISYHQRDAGSIEEWQNRIDGTDETQVVGHIEPTGTFVGAIGASDESIPAFQVGSGISGAPGLRAAEGLYLTLMGQLPSGYVGDHGAITLRNSHPMDAGTLLELSNGLNGTTTDKVFNVTHRGGIFTLGAMCEWMFDDCPDNVRGGTIQYDVCEERWKQCTSTGWIPFQLVGD